MLKKYRDIIILLISLVVIFQLYLYTMVPVFKSDDSPETITSTYTLGIGHPPSYPFFTMAGKAFSLLPVGSPAFRVNLFAVFLAMLVLLLSYFIIKQSVIFIFNYENKIIDFLGVFILAFSFIFWNQAIEAKGGVYILNLLFLAILILLSMKLFKVFNIKYFYIMSFIYGLSLSNHWPSMIILLPVFGYLFFKHKEKINWKNTMAAALLLLAGLSPYLYLPIRAGTDGIFVYMVKTNTWGNFWLTVLRSLYLNDVPATLQVYKYQIKEFVILSAKNYFVLWILILAGCYIIYKKSKEIFYFYLTIILITVFMVIIYNRSEESLMWQTDIFLMPYLYIAAFFIIAGIYWILQIFKQKIAKNIVTFIILIPILLSGYINLNKNNSRYDYQAYDFGKNILKTMDKDSLYLCEGDYNIVPYIQIIEKQGQDVKLINVPYLTLELKTKNYVQKYGNIALKANEPEYNISNIIAYYEEKNIKIFKSTLSPYMDKLKLDYHFKQTGLMQKYSMNINPMPVGIFELYSYNRELYDKYLDYSGRNTGLIMLYPFCMIRQGDELLSTGNPAGALRLYKKAMLFPLKDIMKENEHVFYYNMSLAYKKLNNKDNQIKYLRKAIKAKENFWQAYEALGEIYFKDGIFPPAKGMLEKAIKYGSNNAALLRTHIATIEKIDLKQQYEAIFNEATSLMTKGNFEKAMDIYEFLLERNYQAAVINKNIGVYYFQKNDFERALEYFKKVKELDKNSEIYLYIAFTYYKMGKMDKALAILKESLSVFSNDPQLLNLYDQVKQAKEK